jgi:hypothetical protein
MLRRWYSYNKPTTHATGCNTLKKYIFVCWFGATSVPSHLFPPYLSYLLSQLSLVNQPYTDLSHSMYQISCPFPWLKSFIRRIHPIPRLIVTLCNWQIFLLWWVLATSWWTMPWWLCLSTYSIYPQLPSISRGHLLLVQSEDAPCWCS